MTQAALAKSYATLRDNVRNTLLLGQQKIEEAKVRTYWETGKLISEHILHHKDRAEYGRRTLERLSRDLEVGTRLLERTLQFFRQFPEIPSGRTELTWSHYRALLTVPDEKKRLDFMRKAVREEWISEDLEAAIRKAQPFQPRSLKSVSGVVELLPVPKQGLLNTYRLKASRDTPWPVKDILLLDHGFKSYRALTSQEARGLKTDGVVEWTGTKLLKSGRTVKDLWTYKAYSEKIIDGDTYWVVLDLGLGEIGRQKLRLRGIDCPEINTPEGKVAKKFVEELLRDVPFLTVLSHKNDKYDRYEADVFFVDTKGQEVYLNNLLLEQGYAGRMET